MDAQNRRDSDAFRSPPPPPGYKTKQMLLMFSGYVSPQGDDEYAHARNKGISPCLYGIDPVTSMSMPGTRGSLPAYMVLILCIDPVIQAHEEFLSLQPVLPPN